MSDGHDVTLYGCDLSNDEQHTALREGRVPVAVYGLGKMGLPLAAVYAETTGNVVGVDVDGDVVAAINRGECPIEREPGLADVVTETVESGAFVATTDGQTAAATAHVHVVIVPTEVEQGRADLRSVEAVCEVVGPHLDAGDLVVVESTVPPGTCRERLFPTLLERSSLDAATFGLAFCPERTSSGRALRDVRGAYPKVVGGIDSESTRVAALIYDELVANDVIPVSDVTTAECVKVFEGVYRDVNIALANELATLTDELGVDVVEAIDVANTQPYCDIHRPGIGVGGHCIPYYPYFLIGEATTELPLLQTARGVNDGMPSFAVEKLREELQNANGSLDGAAVALLGLTYRPGVAETRKSPARPVAVQLGRLGATVYGIDPLLDDVSEFAVTPASVDEIPELDLDAAVLATAHEEFDAIDWASLPPLVVVDGRQALDLWGTHHRVYTVGRGVTNRPHEEESCSDTTR